MKREYNIIYTLSSKCIHEIESSEILGTLKFKSAFVNIKVSNKIMYTHLARTVINSDGHATVTIYEQSIKEVVRQGYILNGIKPKNFEHALQIVIEHEISHIANNYLGGSGHDKGFKRIAFGIFKHKEVVGRKDE